MAKLEVIWDESARFFRRVMLDQVELEDAIIKRPHLHSGWNISIGQWYEPLLICSLGELDDLEHLDIRGPKGVPYTKNIYSFSTGRHKLSEEPCFQIFTKFDVEDWDCPWSIREYKSRLIENMANRAIGEIEFERSETASPNVLYFRLNRIETDTSFSRYHRFVTTVYEPMMLKIWDDLRGEGRADALRFDFYFQPSVRSACEQYLTYFAQFLADLGVHAQTTVQQLAGETLFTVVPNSDKDALGRIKDALDTYLSLPFNPTLDQEIARTSDVAAMQLASQVHNLKAQVLLMQAELRAQRRETSALEAENFVYRQRLNELETKRLPSGQAQGSGSDSEPLFGDLVRVDPIKLHGITLNAPEVVRQVLRRLKRRFPGD